MKLAPGTGCFTRNFPYLWKTFLWLNYLDLTEDNWIRSNTVTEIEARWV